MRVWLLILLALASLSPAAPLHAQQANSNVPLQFTGRLVAQFLPDGRRVELLENYTYVDPAGEVWMVPKGTVVDGASIPRAFWTLIGGPFEGKYRNASVVHDYFCVMKNRPWESVHKMFYEAMLESGVERQRAKVMYYAVYYFGPRWETVNAGVVALNCAEGADISSCTPEVRTQPITVDLGPRPFNATEVKADIQKILDEDPSLQDIRAMHE